MGQLLIVVQNPRREVRRVAEFLSSFLSDSQLDDILRATTLAEMKKNELCNYKWWKEADGAHLHKGAKHKLSFKK